MRTKSASSLLALNLILAEGENCPNGTATPCQALCSHYSWNFHWHFILLTAVMRASKRGIDQCYNVMWDYSGTIFLVSRILRRWQIWPFRLQQRPLDAGKATASSVSWDSFAEPLRPQVPTFRIQSITGSWHPHSTKLLTGIFFCLYNFL